MADVTFYYEVEKIVFEKRINLSRWHSFSCLGCLLVGAGLDLVHVKNKAMVWRKRETLLQTAGVWIYDNRNSSLLARDCWRPWAGKSSIDVGCEEFLKKRMRAWSHEGVVQSMNCRGRRREVSQNLLCWSWAVIQLRELSVFSMEEVSDRPIAAMA